MMMAEKKSMLFAKQLKATRRLAGLSQYAVAKKTGLSKQTISKLEAGRVDPVWSTVQRIAAALGVSCEVFIDPSLEMPEAEATPQRKRKKGRKPSGQ